MPACGSCARSESFLTDPDATPITTTLLLRRLGEEADESAWGEFDARFRGVILSMGLRLGLDRSEAEDAAQETMLQAFRDYRSGRYDRERGRLSSWLISIAHHRVIDVQRRRKRDRSDDDPGVTDPGRAAEAFDIALERRVFEEAWSWLCAQGGVRESALRAFELTTMRSVPIAAAAEACGMTVEQVYVARNRVSARLRDAVERVDRAYRDGL